MKITNKSKKAATPPSQVAEFITKVLDAPDEQLVHILASIESWKWPRSDLNAWIKVLNKFDSILEDIINQYEVEKVQLVTFPSQTKALISEILRFERLLLENTTNRKTFSSYDRLDSFLLCSDLDIVVLSLNVLLRPALQYSSQSSISQLYITAAPHLIALAKRWPHLREYGISLVDLVGGNRKAEIEALPTDAREVSFNFYRTEANTGASTEKKKEAELPEAPTTPSKSSSTQQSSSTGPVNILINESTLQSQSPMRILADCIRVHRVPEEDKFELLSRIRATQALLKGHEEEREKLVIARLLSLAIYAHTHTESQATSLFFLYEPDLISTVADLLHVEHDVSIAVQTAAIAVLDAFTRYRNRCQEVLTAVNVGVNHGILMALFRKTVNDVANPSSTIPQHFVETLLQFVTLIATHTNGVNMIVGAGLIPLLVQLVENRLPNRLPMISKTLQLIDSVLYSFQNGFTLLVAARGVSVLVDRIEYEIDHDIQEYGQDAKSCEIQWSSSELPITRASVLKHLLRTMHRMMQSSGTSEGLRGLIDTSLVKSIKKIIDNRGFFGPNVLPIAINIMAIFVHNEPTSLGIIQEAGLPESFYNAIETGIEPSIEVIQAIPNALGALCLNEAGQKQLSNRPSIIPAVFSIFTSERYLKILIDKENAVVIGTAIDELVRHHPLLKAAVFGSLKSVLITIEEIGMSYQVPTDLLHWYRLIPSTTTPLDTDVKMEDIAEGPSASAEAEMTDAPHTDSPNNGEDSSSKPHDNVVVSFIDIICRFLEGLFQHAPHCREFINVSDGLRRLGRLTALPCLPYDFSNSVASDSLVQVMRTLVDFATNDTILHLSKIVRESLEETKDFWQTFEPSSKLLPLLDINDDNKDRSNHRYRSLVTLHIRVSLLSDVFGTVGYSHGRAAISLLQTLIAAASGQLVPELGTLHRAVIWENMTLNTALSSKGIPQSSLTPALEDSPNESTSNLMESSASLNAGMLGSTNGLSSIGGSTSAGNQGTKSQRDETPVVRNAAALKYLTHGIPNVLAPFFQYIVKMFHARRNPEPAQKKTIREAAAVLAKMMLKHLQIPQFDDIASLYIYYSVIFGLYAVLLVDERTSTSNLHTVLLNAFYQIGGFDEILNVASSFNKSIEAITKLKEEERTEVSKKTLVHAYGGVKVLLHFLYPLIASKPLFESPQTVILITRDKKETDPDFFNPNNFLVKLRLKILPLLQAFWEAPWLVQAPLSVSRSIVRSVLEVINAENEQSKVEINVEGGVSHISRPPGPDEHRVQMLVEMGFPRSAAERALIHTRNNVNAATDFLLAHPFAFPPDPINPQTASAEPTSDDSTPAVEGQSSTPAETSTVPSPQPQTGVDVLKEEAKTIEEWKKTLDEAREPLREQISRRALVLIDEHQSLLFELHTAFVRSDPRQTDAIRELVEDVKSFSPYAYDVQEQPLANRCRLLALVLTEAPSALDQSLRESLMDNLLALLLSGIDPENPPRWLASHLLVLESLLTLADEPRTITLPKKDEPINPEALSTGCTRSDAKNIIFDFSLRLLAVQDLPSDELLSVLRLLVYFTKDRQMVKQFVERSGLVHIFRHVGASEVTGGSSYIITILRHLIEDRSLLYNIMYQSIKRYFKHPRTGMVDVLTYVRNCNAMAFRDTDVFLDATKSVASLCFPYSTTSHVTIRSELEGKNDSSTEQPEGNEMQVEPILPGTPTIDNNYAENVIHLLLTELVDTIKVLNEGPNTVTTTSGTENTAAPLSPEKETTTTSSSPSEQKPRTTTVNRSDKCQYACFLMQCLTELLFSYDSCKSAFLSYSPTKKKSHTPLKEPANRFRSGTLHFLLNDVINPGNIDPSPNDQVRQQLGLCNWAMSTIVALCVDSSSVTQEAKDISQELVSIRKFVLETVNRAIKDILSIENLDARYAKMLAYADLCHRLLTVRFNTGSNPPRKQQEEIPTHIAKVMLEKNFVSTLTTILSEVDLNFPNVRHPVTAILRPLQYLTKIAIKMSRGTKNKDAAGSKKVESERLTVSSDEEDEGEAISDGEREETPDVYRTSALGMYGGEMDDSHYSDTDGMDEDEEEEGDVEMDFGDATGSEETSEDEDDEEGEDELEEEDEGEAGEVWDSIDEVEEEDEEEEQHLVEHNENQDEEEIMDDDELEEEVDEDGNPLWEDVPHPHEDGLVSVGEEIDDDEDRVPVHVYHEDDDLDMGSDDESLRLENGLLPASTAIFPFGEPFINISGRDAPPVFISRRSRTEGDDLQVFGRARNAPAPPPETTTHPLLLDNSNNTARTPTNIRRGPRHTHRNISIGTDIFQALDDIVGPGSAQFFQQIFAATPGAAQAFQFDVGNTLINLERLNGRRHNHGVISAAIRVERGPRPQGTRGREFDPLLTLQRWAEEAKVLHGEFVNERSTKLVNHIILALLPAAVEKMKNAEKLAESKEKEEGKNSELLEAEGKQEAEPRSTMAEETRQEETRETQETQEAQEVQADISRSNEPSASDGQPMEVTPADQDVPMTDATDDQTAEENALESSSSNQASQRITVMIHGSPVDITDTGIDPTFLEALPDDMREEVLNQHVRDQRAATIERPSDSQISVEFLDALPPEIRAEIIQQEAMERAHQRAQESLGQVTQGTDDAAGFLASLDPTLRQAVLMDEGGLSASDLLAEVENIQTQSRRPVQRNTGQGSAPSRKYTINHDTIQLLDKAGIAALVRLLFYPQVTKKTLLFKVLVNLCENAKTRAELFNLLLGILQDSPGDLASVDKSFSQLTVRNSKPQTPKSTGKQKPSSEYFSTLTSLSTRIDAVPDLIVQRCLECLTYIVTANEIASLFFLTEHELPAGLRKASNKKGKGKEKQASQTHYPIVLLLGLLDRQPLIRTPAIMESVVSLLATVTRPLTSLKLKEPTTTTQDTQPDSKPGAPVAPSQPSEAPENKEAKPSLEALEEKVLLANPPQIPHAVLRLIVNILTIGECSARTFQQSLTLIQHLSYIPDAREVIAQELRSKAEEFGHALFADLKELLTALQGPQEELNAVAAKFSPASSLQAKLLRVLKTIDHMYSAKSPPPNGNEADVDKVQAIYESFRFTQLWKRLGECLSIIEEKPETEHIAIVLLPLIEALMVVCKYVSSKANVQNASRALRGSMSPKTPLTGRESMEDLFFTFTDAHRKVLNLMVRNNPSLMSGSFALLVNNSRVLDFDNKRNYFNQQLHRRPSTREHYGTIQLNVRRQRVFEDSFQHLQRKTGDQIKYGKLSIRFYDEEGVDAGGVTREWFQILARQMFDPNNALFQPCAADKLTYQPNKNSWVNPEHLAFFKFVGRVIGKAIYDGRLLDAYFAKSLYRQILGKPVDYRDVEWVDPEYYNSLCWILENDPTVLDLTFSVEADEFGVSRIVPLKENGEQIPVTQENKREFVQLSAQYRLYSSIKDQIESLLSGFYEIIPKDLITIFNEQELELLISGTPDIDVDEWRAATEYSGYTSSDPNIVWWWRALKSFNREERAKVLSFATGTSRVPLSGFVDLQGVQGVQRFSIHRAYGAPDRLPQAHTCFNQIDLPQYSSYEMLRQQLLLAIIEGGEGFAFS